MINTFSWIFSNTNNNKKQNDEYILLDLDDVLVGRQKKFLKACQIIIEQLKRFFCQNMTFKISHIMSNLSPCALQIVPYVPCVPNWTMYNVVCSKLYLVCRGQILFFKKCVPLLCLTLKVTQSLQGGGYIQFQKPH